MSSLAHKAGLGWGTQYGIVQAWLAGYGVPQVKLLVRVLAGLVCILKVFALAPGQAHQENKDQPQAGAGWPHAVGGEKGINCDILQHFIH